MKKLLVTIVAMAMMLAAFAVPASASNIDEVMAAAKEAIPDKYEYLYVSQMETVLKATNPDEEECEMLIALVEKYAGLITDKGPSLHSYSEEEVASIMADIDVVAEKLGFEYEIVSAESDDVTDVKMVVYFNGAPITELDGDTIEQTGAEESVSMVWPVALGAVVLAAAAAFVFGKKIFA